MHYLFVLDSQRGAKSMDASVDGGFMPTGIWFHRAGNGIAVCFIY